MSDDLLADVVSYARQLSTHRNRQQIGTADNPYLIYVPKWFAERCEAEGTTPQEVYDRTYGSSSFRHGRVEVVKDVRR